MRKNYQYETMGTLMQKFVDNRKIDEELLDFMKEEEAKKLRLFWSIWYDTKFSQLNQLEEKIFMYGDLLKETDYFERGLFVYMYTVLRMLRMYEEDKTEIE